MPVYRRAVTADATAHLPPGVLGRIVASHRAAAQARRRPLDDLLADVVVAVAAGDLGPTRPFRERLRGRAHGAAVIAELKRRSPSKGELAPGLVASDLARSYETGGAACLSVLTDTEYFGGSPADLAEARAACALPVLRKDFTVCEHDVVDARLMGADAVLLIVAALTDEELTRFRTRADELAMAALVEVHDEIELERALAAGADLVGVNRRDLRTFEVHPARAEELVARIPEGVVSVAESGVSSAADAARLHDAGYDAVLVGETLVTAADPAAAVRELLGG